MKLQLVQFPGASRFFLTYLLFSLFFSFFDIFFLVCCKEAGFYLLGFCDGQYRLFPSPPPSPHHYLSKMSFLAHFIQLDVCMYVCMYICVCVYGF